MIESAFFLRIAGSLPADGVDFVDEKDAGSENPGQREHVTDSSGTKADIYFDEF